MGINVQWHFKCKQIDQKEWSHNYREQFRVRTKHQHTHRHIFKIILYPMSDDTTGKSFLIFCNVPYFSFCLSLKMTLQFMFCFYFIFLLFTIGISYVDHCYHHLPKRVRYFQCTWKRYRQLVYNFRWTKITNSIFWIKSFNLV